mmetsp:Transcript_17824/g.21359  ORF Transcript_17824/g.21359 Transcript_17824/m.21359 type:complete len:280 (+) Transcript_17824:82-921(+)|eukprot:CAMPEP_0197864868 /NCGR_PEP_ID=MMETSP1438-20131217/43334_1 /TAXON_ID=1461541 /ORGANISM="Pterosperma sp., Strain CCMP1384" /LENGTH=279 /DNA_ID=CAMNT_0043483243 /DNA_START=79 /DNA_END=918 /DNA_ORIENTATION=+
MAELKVEVKPPGALEEELLKEAPKEEETGYKPSIFEKGNVANFTMFVIMVVGLVMRFTMDTPWEDNTAAKIILAFGLFGFSGGLTNWIAIVMLFDEVPGLYGSGIIPKQFKQIRITMKNMIMDTFFDPKFLDKQLKDKLGKFSDPELVEEKLTTMIDSPDFDKVLDEKLAALADKPIGMMLSMMSLTAEKIKPFVKPFLSGVASDLGPMLAELAKGDNIPIHKLRDEVEKLMDERLLELTPERVKALIEAIMREHLGWLVVWGCVFGGVIGVVSELAGY